MLTGVYSINELTLASWSNVLPSRELFSQSKKWCPKCFEDWKKNNQIIYEPIIWNFKEVNICKIHGVRLKTECPYCSKPIPVLTRTSRNGFCPYCRSWLGSNDITDEIVDSKHNSWKYFVVNNIGTLLKAKSEEKTNWSQDNIVSFLESLIEKTVCAFSRCFDIPKSTVSSWFGDNHKPILQTLLKICYRLDINIIEVLSSNELHVSLISEKDYNDISRENKNTNNSKVRRKIDWDNVEEKLIGIINNKDFNTSSVREVARNLNCNARLLYSHFPDLCKKISEDHDIFIRYQKIRKDKEKRQKVLEVTFDLYNQGVYPTRRKVEAILDSNISLRRKDNYSIWKDAVKSFQ